MLGNCFVLMHFWAWFPRI